MDTNPKTTIVKQKDALPRIKTSATELLNQILLLADDKLKRPFELTISSAVLTFASSEQQLLQSDGAGNTENSNKIAPTPAKEGYSVIAQSTIDVSDGAATGDIESATPSIPVTVPAGEYVWMGFEKRVDQKIYLIFGQPHATAGSATFPTFTFKSGIKHIGMILLKDDGSGSSGLTWNFENPIISNAIIFEASGGAGGGAGDAAELLERAKIRFNSGIWDWMTPYIFILEEDALADGGNTTAAFSIVESAYEFVSPGDILQTIQLLEEGFLLGMNHPESPEPLTDITKVEFFLYYDIDNFDTNPTLALSRNGTDFQNATMERLGESDTYRVVHEFTEEVANSFSQNVGGTPSGVFVVDDTNPIPSRAFTLANATVLKELIYGVTVTGSPVGGLTLKIVRDDTGSPSTDPNDIMIVTNPLNIADFVTGDVSFFVDGALEAGDYHMILEQDQEYKDNYSGGTNKIDLDFNSGITFDIEGRELELLAKITGGDAGSIARGLVVFYSPDEAVKTLGGQFLRKRFTFDGQVDNLNEFDADWIIDKDLAVVHDVNAGQGWVWGDGAWVSQGKKVIFDTGFFNRPGNVTIEIRQVYGSIDNSDKNIALLAANFLGSTDSSISHAQAGRGIHLKNANGVLRELTIDENDDIAIKATS